MARPVRGLRLRSACYVLLSSLGVAGCTSAMPYGGGNANFGGANLPEGSTPLFGPGQSTMAQPAQGSFGKVGGNVALLVPLTGTYAAVGQALVNAAKLALPDGGTPSLDVRDTGGTAAGAVAAAQAAIAAGDGIILGPLTSPEAHAVAPIANGAGVAALAFTNDGTVATANVWPLGITPAQQVQRVMKDAADAGHNSFAALLPDSDFGHHLGAAITAQAASLGQSNPAVTFYEPGFGNINVAVKSVSDFADRGSAFAQIKKDEDEGTAQGRADADRLRHQPVAPPPFNALFIGETDPAILAEIANFLPYYFVGPGQVQFMGPTPWGAIASTIAGQVVYHGAIFAAPDPAGAAGFDGRYTSAYGSAPPSVADVAFDAATIAHVAAAAGGYTTSVLTSPAGFSGVDGAIILAPDGQVARGLAVLAIGDGGATLSAPAPNPLAPPSS
jgi:branched-chain amino acid transport system substrate-binding protein